jgi:hypothetical protein
MSTTGVELEAPTADAEEQQEALNRGLNNLRRGNERDAGRQFRQAAFTSLDLIESIDGTEEQDRETRSALMQNFREVGRRLTEDMESPRRREVYSGDEMLGRLAALMGDMSERNAEDFLPKIIAYGQRMANDRETIVRCHSGSDKLALEGRLVKEEMEMRQEGFELEDVSVADGAVESLVACARFEVDDDRMNR